MQLSAAMIAGSAGLRQAYGAFYEWEDDVVSACCAEGAIYIGMGCPAGRTASATADPLPRRARDDLQTIVKCPVTGVFETVRLIIQTLNDRFKWTRERIAAWLQRLGF